MAGIYVLCIAYVFSQFFRAFLAVLTPVLSKDLGMDATEFAYASGAWFVAFALFQFPVGILLDTVGPRRTAGVIFTVFCGGGAFLFAFASGATAIILAMALIGIGCSPALMAPFYIFVRNFDAAKFATLSATFIGVGTLGNIASSEPLAAAVEVFGWREASSVLAIGSALVGIAILVLVRDPEKLTEGAGRGGFIDILKIRELWPIFPMVLIGYTVAAGLRGSWIGPFNADLYGYDTLQIGRVTLYMSIALVLGTFFYGPLDRVFNTRKWVVMGGNLVVFAVCGVMALAIPEDPFWSMIAFIAIGFFGASYAVQMAHGKSFVPKHLTGRGVTLLNFCSIGGAGVFQWLSGSIVGYSSVEGQAAAQYQALFTFYFVLMTVAVVAYLFSRDVRPNS